MGMTTSINLPTPTPTWSIIRERLIAHGHTPQMRLIDGMPAFPDEDPPEAWREIRISFGGEMISIRNQGNTWDLVTWGNADAVTQQQVQLLKQLCSGD